MIDSINNKPQIKPFPPFKIVNRYLEVEHYFHEKHISCNFEDYLQMSSIIIHILITRNCTYVSTTNEFTPGSLNLFGS